MDFKKLLGSFHKTRILFSWQRIWAIIVVAFVLFAVLFTGLVAYAASFSEKVLPGIHVGSIPIGGLTRAEVQDILQNMNDKLTQEGMRFQVMTPEENFDFVLYPVIVSDSGDSIDLIKIEVEKEVDRLMVHRKGGDMFTRAFSAMRSRITPEYLQVQNIYENKGQILASLQNSLEKYEKPPIDAKPIIHSLVPFDYEIQKSQPGLVFHYNDILGQVRSNWSQLQSASIELSVESTEPRVKESDIEPIEQKLQKIFDGGALDLVYIDPQTELQRKWNVSTQKIRSWIEVQKNADGAFVFGVNRDAFEQYLKDAVEPFVTVEPRNARFEVGEDGKVKAFETSRPGVGVDVEKTWQLVNEVLSQRMWHDEGVAKVVTIATIVKEPSIKTGEVNDLGITELLGVGVSDYSRSPANRIHNIKNGVTKLSGIILEPGQEFSAIEFTQPYTLEGGYLPEKVIKGDEIKAEIGGGLCQIGTTLFRMAMNSGMQITERRNHSLAVFHYNDPVNGLPGTDATIYDPAPDFKFKNDTDHHVLIQTYMDTATEELRFELWGTSDGRKGSYTHPVVHAWIPYGEPQIIETEKLEPGQEECQSPFRGARASFTYTRVMPGSEEPEETVFESYYRPLPQICLKGIDPNAPKEGEEAGETPELVPDQPAEQVATVEE
ncbi:VanW family protein [Candidatus Nomurabacteria bacterium]|nr:VanW family protein [Candidatus Nomurabacteria bacterium]